MKKSTKIILVILTALAFAVCLCCCLFIFHFLKGGRLNRQLQSMTRQESRGDFIRISADQGADEYGPEEETPEQPEAEESAEELPDWYINVDFAALSQLNEDIYAWIHIPDTNISYPVVQSPEDDLYYNSHGVDGSYYPGGSIFSQRYNSLDFSDPVSVLYGHNYDFTAMFAQLNDYADPEFFADHPLIYIYTPGKVLCYSIFAACPYSAQHLLLCNDFTDPVCFDSFFGELGSPFDANYLDESFPTEGDRVLVLSTCYKNNRMQRYLVMAVLETEYAIEVQ